MPPIRGGSRMHPLSLALASRVECNGVEAFELRSPRARPPVLPGTILPCLHGRGRTHGRWKAGGRIDLEKQFSVPTPCLRVQRIRSSRSGPSGPDRWERFTSSPQRSVAPGNDARAGENKPSRRTIGRSSRLVRRRVMDDRHTRPAKGRAPRVPNLGTRLFGAQKPLLESSFHPAFSAARPPWEASSGSPISSEKGISPNVALLGKYGTGDGR